MLFSPLMAHYYAMHSSTWVAYNIYYKTSKVGISLAVTLKMLLAGL